MSNACNRESAPGQARDAFHRPGTFLPGHAKVGGRKKGTPNAIPPTKTDGLSAISNSSL
jgi:hypothetical protein